MKARKADLMEILALQKLAFREEAILYDDFEMQPMIQHYEDICREFTERLFLKCVSADGGIVGSVRAHVNNEQVCLIGKLIVHPDFRDKGIGTRLINKIERHFRNCRRYEIFTGEKSYKTLYLYGKHGYIKTHIRKAGKYNLVYMEKPNPAWK